MLALLLLPERVSDLRREGADESWKNESEPESEGADDDDTASNRSRTRSMYTSTMLS